MTLRMNQQQLFADDEEPGLSIASAASQLEVSTASVRNWIKTGYIHQTARNLISRASFDDFKKNVAGHKKLTARANKSLKDSHDHKKTQQTFYDLIARHGTDFENTSLRYQDSLSNAYRNKEGIYYTPTHIVQRFFQHLPDDCASLSFCDPCCGSGNFILAAIAHGIRPENIYGYDIDPIAVALTQKRIRQHTGYQPEQIICADFLKSSLNPDRICFDIIFTNPPWGKKITPEQKALYARLSGTGKSVDSSSLFFFECLSRLKVDGYLGFLLPDAFFNVGTFEHARKKALSLNIKVLMDFGKPFKQLLTKAKGIIIQNRAACDDNLILCETIDQIESRTLKSFNKNPKSIVNFSCSSAESKAIDHLYQQQHLTLTANTHYGLGIVTGNNKKYCIAQPKQNYIAAYRGAEIHKDRLDPASAYIPDDLSLYQQVAPKALFLAKEKLVYRFISSKLIFYHDTEQIFFLNSANMLILADDFPINARQLSQILNSKVINWLFQKTFETHKVLRSDIESLPIHAGYFDTHSIFTDETFLNYLNMQEQHDGTFRIKK